MLDAPVAQFDVLAEVSGRVPFPVDAGLMMAHWPTPEDQRRNARKVEEALLNPELLAPLERQYGIEFVAGYREVVSKVVRFLHG